MSLSRIAQADRAFDAGDRRAWTDYLMDRTTQEQYATELRRLAKAHRQVAENYTSGRVPKRGPMPGTALKIDYAQVAHAARSAPVGQAAFRVGIATGCSTKSARIRIARARALGYDIPESPFSPTRKAG